jgi:DNA-binding transcriptional LysR family regulator
MDMLATVIAVARTKAIRAAAEELALTASAVHKRVRNTSKLLGTPLFTATENGMVPTEAGALFVHDAERAVEQALLAEDRITALLEIEGGIRL